MTIHLIRHGMTEATAKKIYCGHSDLPLSTEGRIDIKRIAGEIGYPDAEMLVSSGLARANETLNLIYGSRDYTVIPQLREYNFGSFELKSHDELSALQDYIDWMESDKFPCPGGESRIEFLQRAVSGFSQLCELCSAGGFSSASAVTHGGVVSTVMEHLFPGEKNFYEWHPECGHGYTLTIDSDSDISYKTI